MQMDAVPSDFIEKWIAYFQNLTHIDPWSAGVGLVSVAIIASAPKFSKRIPGSLIAIIVMTVVVLLLKQYAGVTSIETIGDRFRISSELPDAVVPELTWETIKGLVAPALTIATLMAGVFLIGFGLLRLGTIIKYIPYPIIVGFTSGIAVTIFTTLAEFGS